MRPGSRPKKGELPTKVCVACQRPFAWRKKWERCWDEVRYCSERCRRQGVAQAAPVETCPFEAGPVETPENSPPVETPENSPPVETPENSPPVVGTRGGGGRRRRSE
jgi:hypothetical protein